jgi:putative transposase
MRSSREIFPLLPHHFILRGNNRRRLFSYQWEYDDFLRLLADAAEMHGVRVHALALMANHVHLVATPPSKTAASRFVQSFAQRYAQRRNRRRQASGKLFEERFIAIPLGDAAHVANAIAYVDLNPVRGGVCFHPAESPWTTYSLHIGRGGGARIPSRLWTPSAWYLALGSGPAERQVAYEEFVAMCRAKDDAAREGGPELRVRRPDHTRAS